MATLPRLLAGSHTDVNREPTFARPFEYWTQAPNLGLVAFRLRCFHLPKQREEALMQRNLLGSRLLAVIEGFHE